MNNEGGIHRRDAEMKGNEKSAGGPPAVPGDDETPSVVPDDDPGRPTVVPGDDDAPMVVPGDDEAPPVVPDDDAPTMVPGDDEAPTVVPGDDDAPTVVPGDEAPPVVPDDDDAGEAHADNEASDLGEKSRHSQRKTDQGIRPSSARTTSEILAEASGPRSIKFPIDCLPGAMADMVRETAKQTLTPPALSACVALGVASAAIGRGLTVKSGGSRKTGANLFILAIARSGVGKGQTFNFIATPLYAAEDRAIAEWRESRAVEIAASLEVTRNRATLTKRRAARDDDHRLELTSELAGIQRELDQLEKERQACPCYVVADTTREALALTLSSQPGEALATLSPEARGILDIVRGRYSDGASDEDVYLSGYSGEPLIVRRISRPPISLRSPCLVAMWMSQPDAARRFLSDERMTASGLLPRFLLCEANAAPQPEPADMPEMDTGIVERWENLVHQLLDYRSGGGSPIDIAATGEAREILRTFRNECVAHVSEGGELRDVEAYVARWAENAWRLALVLHTVEHASHAHKYPLNADTAQKAVQIVRWFSRHQLAVLAESRNDRFRRRLEKLLKTLRDAGGQKTLGKLKDSNGFEPEEVHELAERFPARLQVRQLNQPGRPCFVACTP